MLKNYLLVAWRNMRRNKAFSIINISGLALGMACSLLIMLWVQDEKNIDAFHTNKSQLYGIYKRMFYDGKVDAGFATPGLLAEEMKRVIPEVEYASGYAWNDKSTFAAGEKIMKAEGTSAGADFFNMFSYPLLQGNPQTALNTPLSIAVSRKIAIAFFGSPQAAINQTLRYEDQKDFKITAVFEDVPAASSIKFDYLINWQAFLEENKWAANWTNNGPLCFLMLKQGANAGSVEAKIKRFLDNYNKEQDANYRIELGMQRFDEMYLHNIFKNGQVAGGRIEYVRIFSIVALFILLIACINFMNLTTARSVKRAKEIGVRKVVGAVRYALVWQFIGEAVLIAFIAVIIAVVLTILVLPYFNTLTGKHMLPPYTNPVFWAGLLALTLLTGVISGSYPAIMLSSFKPVAVLKGKLKFGTGSIWFRKGLVVFQFALSVLLIAGMMIISQQVNYIQTTNLGYNRNNLIYITLEGDLTGKYPLFKEEALKKEGITGITRITGKPTAIVNSTSGVDWEGKDPNLHPEFTQASVGYDFVKTMNLQLLQGRDFSKDFADSASYLLNEAAVAKMGFKDPIGKTFTFWKKKGTIVGVIKDFHFTSLHSAIKPLILRLHENESWGSALVRIEPGKTKQGLAALEKLCKELNPKFPFAYLFADEEYKKQYQGELVINKLSNYFAFLGIFISCLGLLGLVIFTAGQRTREIGIRKVLGASMASVFTLLSKEFLLLVGLAIVIASPLAWWAMNNWLQNFEYRIPIHWWVFAVAGIASIVIALLTISVQAIKTALANPVKSLRTE